ncbi:hypothetical protein F4553_002207 [Allocatelliglobosispora scoriae]|uniref:Uncharacterized protein n=1 Tax=Allocatelliglobosispora scoriae TaxID=643052 RepID=A0A841BN70_9ACTN|nr:hypothetical protein [Allocatelliglobosispora scoriae]MBB5868828.1 hypothetical protein [Allocatelliglobosispora scoriae]
MASEEIRTRAKALPRFLLHLAAQRIPAHLRAETLEEWHGELHQFAVAAEGLPLKSLCQSLRFAVGILSSARKIGRDLSGYRSIWMRFGERIRRVATRSAFRPKERIESGRKADIRRFQSALAIGVLSFIVAPVGLLVAYFGMNASQVDPDYSIFDLHRHWPVYVVALALMLAPSLMIAGDSVRRWRARPK